MASIGSGAHLVIGHYGHNIKKRKTLAADADVEGKEPTSPVLIEENEQVDAEAGDKPKVKGRAKKEEKDEKKAITTLSRKKDVKGTCLQCHQEKAHLCDIDGTHSTKKKICRECCTHVPCSEALRKEVDKLLVLGRKFNKSKKDRARTDIVSAIETVRDYFRALDPELRGDFPLASDTMDALIDFLSDDVPEMLKKDHTCWKEGQRRDYSYLIGDVKEPRP